MESAIAREWPDASLRRRLVFWAAILAVFTAAVEGTIVATAMPTIVADLGGMELFTWVFAVYFLTQALTIPIYGRLSDIVGRKRMFFIGAGIFLVGSILCGSARGMVPLIAFRALQGLGAGGVQPVATTIVGDLFSPAERARVQGLLSGTWGIAAVLGPVLGAFLVEKVSWSAIFWINVPIGITCLVVFGLFLREQRPERKKQPVMPQGLFRNRVVVTGTLGCFAIGALVMAISAFIPTYVQGVLHGTAFVAGAVLAVMSVAWSTGSVLGGRVMTHTTYRRTAAAGGVMLVAGTALLALLDPMRGLPWAGAGGALVGLGFGFSNSSLLVAAQSSVGWEQRGSATASLLFMRQVGQAIGTSLFGAVFNVVVFGRGVPSDEVAHLLDPARRAQLSGPAFVALSDGIARAIHDIFAIAVVLALALLCLAFLIPAGLSAARKRE